MAKPLVDDELWELIQRLLPPPKSIPWPKVLEQPPGADRHHVRPEERRSLGDVAQGNRLQLGQSREIYHSDLLSP